MKTLVIQLARFGDIYQTWPALLALNETGDQEVHLLVRERFAAATEGLPPSIYIHQFKTKPVMEAVLVNDSLDEASLQMQDWLETMDEHGFDRVINLSFSPFSSYLTSHFESHGARVSGYTRHADGFLNFHDDNSAYFYAQVGVDRPNRIHLTQLFAMVSGVELGETHLHPCPVLPSFPEVPGLDLKNSVIAHVSASDLGKALDQSQIHGFIRKFLNTRTENLVFIGLESERALIQKSFPLLGSERLFDLSGKTRIQDLFSIIGQAKGFIGCDSAPLQIASLLNVPILNFRNEHVNSFETGPFSENFELFRFSDWLGDGSPSEPTRLQDEQWKMVQAIYMGSGYSTCIPSATAQALTELVEFLPKVYEASQHPLLKESQTVIHTFDLYLNEKEKTDPLLSIVIRWFNTERVRIPPASLEQVTTQTLEKIDAFYLILSDWVRVLGEEMTLLDESSTVLSQLDDLIKHFRFMNLKVAIEDLQKMLPRLVTASSTEVREKVGRGIREQLESALRLSDYSRVADVLEYQLKPHLQERDVIL